MKENNVEVNVPGETEINGITPITGEQMNGEEKTPETKITKKPSKKISTKTSEQTSEIKTNEKKIIKTSSKKKETEIREQPETKKIDKKKKNISEAPKTLKKNTVKSIAAKPQKEVATKKSQRKKITAKDVTINFVVRFHTKFGQSLYITAQHESFGNGDINNALPMYFLNEECWAATLQLNIASIPVDGIVYNYVLEDEDGSNHYDWGSDKKITPELFFDEQVLILDSWNFAGYYENAFYTEPFKHVLLKNDYTPVSITSPKTFSHVFKVKAPLLQKGQTLFLAGNNNELGNWGHTQPILMSKTENEDFFSVKLNLSKINYPLIYKYGVYDTEQDAIIRFEDGNNRVLHNSFSDKRTIVNDGFVVLPATAWKGAGVSIPVFSLRSQNSLGVGEFTDIKLLVDWAKKVGLKLVQILPVNDTTATHTWTDSYPYAAISAFALHPIYLNIQYATHNANKHILDAVSNEQRHLNKLDALDYTAVNELKWRLIHQLYPLQKDEVFALQEFKQFFDLNKDWLVPYAAFCYFRDKYNTADFNQWGTHKTYNAKEVEALLQPSSATYDKIAVYFFVQYYLHEQLKQATEYAHNNGVIVKGDIPIGIYRYGVDAWQHPELYHMDMQAGAPPDDFAVTGQNWGFPTYNWEKMREDHYAWWKQRFEQMSFYFDAFRIDHILGFFRIWSIPYHSLEGIMGHFEPALSVHINEFNEKDIWFDYNRYCKPYITDAILNDIFGDQQNHVRHAFLDYDGFAIYRLKSGFDTQRKIENYFSWQQDNEHNRWLKKRLFDLLSNVILFEAEGTHGRQFHFRFAMQETSSFKNLDAITQQRLNDLYLNYFFRRQDHFWMKAAMEKLPALKRATNMLVCGEDLGLVPAGVPEVMRQTGILSLEIQRMPKDPKREFFHPADAPYLSVVTPSTHDMSTIRGWWEEDRTRTQHFFNNELGQWGEAPYFCDAWVNDAIIVQHLHSPAMWAIFQLPDILGSDTKLRRPNPHEERINVPANPKHYWKFRMHLNLEDLITAEEFNEKFSKNVKASGRA
jgi:4-alpha-glucanotransferase